MNSTTTKDTKVKIDCTASTRTHKDLLCLMSLYGECILSRILLSFPSCLSVFLLSFCVALWEKVKHGCTLYCVDA
jgi:hypothetical protein